MTKFNHSQYCVTLAKPIHNDMQHPVLLHPVLLHPVLLYITSIFHEIAFRCFLKTSITYISRYTFGKIIPNIDSIK